MSKIKVVRMSWNENFVMLLGYSYITKLFLQLRTTNKKVLFLKKIGVLLIETVKNLIFWIVTRVSTRDYMVPFFQNIMNLVPFSILCNLSKNTWVWAAENPTSSSHVWHWWRKLSGYGQSGFWKFSGFPHQTWYPVEQFFGNQYICSA